MSSWTGCTSTSGANPWNRCTNFAFETGLGGRRAAATDALDPVSLVSRDLPRQGQPAIKGQVRDGHEEGLIGVLLAKIEFGQDAAFVARIVDLGNLALGRQVKTGGLLAQLGQHGGCRKRGQRQGCFELGHEKVSLKSVVDHEQLSLPDHAAAGRICPVFQAQGRSSCRRKAGWSGSRVRTSASQACGSTSLSLAVSISV